jgi:predicted metal-dependent hydrolase
MIVVDGGRGLRPLARQAVELFNAGEYYRQHDLLEELWIEERGPSCSKKG